ncbi:MULTISPECIES: LLM class flavin-dependent oxidoreductase [Bacillus]|uniref:LLM class flavin-dependent oxidoreductase n=1 Tax=Bacillus TaxID=1386 RepID=UPI0009C82843|nr:MULTISPECIES: LLM class flavin-dependent oxidoreductase [Bacillus]SLC27596.1 putative luciferase-like oxidoreductase [Mycobacteroides abscessus subsp. massiliense]MBL3626166.1 LLM class flavin-dependent oxidoreductase [Bacillus sp. RHF6]MDH3103082.1 LLM class flavin-dependent oxidoreductase [Bacillus velezensis]MEC1896758.1 LLM class flavin-dependent oxidoreductase [Bacillus velezensis]MEC1915906.1 LLM class flavin-dependent oxidoreductase [Bacillus velezensis]
MRAEHRDCMEIGIYSFAELYPDPLTGKTVSAKQRIDELMKLAKLADDAGLDVFGVGEHHRLDYAVSSPPAILSAISQITENIKLTSATTVLSTADPVRLFEDFATLDLISDGRAEIIAGRGAFLDSFPLFGYDVGHYKELFEEHIDLFLKLNSGEESVTWKGRYRPPLREAEISPRPFCGSIPLWLGVSGTPESAERAGRAGAGLALAVLSGDPVSSKPLVDKYREAASKAGHPPENVKVAVTGHMFISKTNEQAIQEFYPYHSNYWSHVHSYHGIDEPLTKEDFERASGKETALFVGSSQQIIEKIMHQYELFGHQRFLAQIDIGGMPFKKAAENIERLAAEVAPVIRKETGKSSE